MYRIVQVPVCISLLCHGAPATPKGLVQISMTHDYQHHGGDQKIAERTGTRCEDAARYLIMCPPVTNQHVVTMLSQETDGAAERLSG